jgi:uncharacterized membrane protein (UPF0127 family)
MNKTTRKRFIDWTITIALVALLAFVVWLKFFRTPRTPQGATPDQRPWTELPVVATVEVARTQDEIVRGLMGRVSLPRNHGMYFAYDDSAERDFWMDNTRIPLSIAFIRADGTIAVIKDMQPFDTRYTSSDEKVKDALEMSQGWFAENDIRVGDRAELHDDGTVHFSSRRQ